VESSIPLSAALIAAYVLVAVAISLAYFSRTDVAKRVT
jgi:hypothetical protein